MAKYPGDNFDRHASSEHQGGRRVAQIVWPELADLGSIASLDEVPIEVTEIDRRADLGREDEIGIAPMLARYGPFLCLSGFVRFQLSQQLVGHMERSPTTWGLDVTKNEAAILPRESSSDHQ